MYNLYAQIDRDDCKIGDYAILRYTKRKLGIVTGRYYSKILCKDLITCSDYDYEIDIRDCTIFRVMKHGIN